jgi:hypothetical protein
MHFGFKTFSWIAKMVDIVISDFTTKVVSSNPSHYCVLLVEETGVCGDNHRLASH